MKKLVIVLLSFMNLSVIAECIEDLGVSDVFGSHEQLKHIQEEIQTNECEFIQIKWSNKTSQGDMIRRMIALDFNEGVMMRARIWPHGEATWESWYGFNKSVVLNDDPSDGFNLPNYTTSFDKSRLSKELNKAFKQFRQEYGSQ